ncbi:MAG: hypothetical protein IH597_08875 [Bacteroidales bacterium]|nr:hypothetical protein [Bacteroidales bacterium]
MNDYECNLFEKSLSRDLEGVLRENLVNYVDMDKIDLKDLFYDFQRSMEVELNINRNHIPHEGEKGGASEARWIEWLNSHLPNRYEVGRAFVIDCDGNKSKQLDLVIYDCQYTPFVFNKDERKFIPAESVYAVFDVKQSLNKENLIDTSMKIESVRALRRTTAKIYDARGEITKTKPPIHILGGILCTSSDWNPALGDPFEKHIKSLRKNAFIDLGCIIDEGAFLAKICDDQVMISRSTKNEVLLFFFLNLFMELQKVGTVTAMDVVEYAKALKSI